MLFNLQYKIKSVINYYVISFQYIILEKSYAEFHEVKHSLISGSRMILQKLEKGARADENVEISLTTVGEYADIMKDFSEVVKNMCKASHYRTKFSSKML